jgi:adenosylcobinamide-phosphate synthase
MPERQVNYGLFVIPAGYILDLLWGDPQMKWHPVRLIGKLAEKLEKRLNKPGYSRKFSGTILVVLAAGTSAAVAWGMLQVCAAIHKFLFYAVSAVFIYFALSIRNLADEAYKIKRSLESLDIRRARDNLAMIVGRDTNNLNEEEIIRATVETVAESAMDGIIAPLFYAFLGGPVLTWVYKTVNTLDSMVGYKNERFNEFGRASAKLDGWLNLIPSKITAVLISISMFFCGKDWLNSLKWSGRYLLRGPAVNSDTSEASMAGGLGIRLGGTNFYNSIAMCKPFLGDTFEPLNIKHISQSVTVSYMVSALMLIAGLAFLKS